MELLLLAYWGLAVAQEASTPSSGNLREKTPFAGGGDQYEDTFSVGCNNVGFGAIRRRSLSDKDTALLALDGQAGDAWKWNARATLTRTVFDQTSPQLDLAGFAAALAAPDPAIQFNPFADASPGSNNVRLYSALTRTLRTAGLAQRNDLAADTRGQVAEGRVGRLSLDVATEYSFNHSDQTLDSASHSDFFRSSGHLMAFRSAVKAGSTETSGVVWVPIQSLTFRGKYAKQQTPPPTTFFQPSIAYNQTLVDPRRSPSTATDVEVIDDVPANLDPSLSQVESVRRRSTASGYDQRFSTENPRSGEPARVTV